MFILFSIVLLISYIVNEKINVAPILFSTILFISY